MKKIISILLAIVLAVSCTVMCAAAEDEITWEEIEMGGKRCDVNDDGKISAVDALMVLKHVVGTQDFTVKQGMRADANKDGKVTSVDARHILKTAAASA